MLNRCKYFFELNILKKICYTLYVSNSVISEENESWSVDLMKDQFFCN